MVYLQDQRGMDINRKWGTTYRVPATLVLICVMLPGKNFVTQSLLSWGWGFCQGECCWLWYHGGRSAAEFLREGMWAHRLHRCRFSPLSSSQRWCHCENYLKNTMMHQRSRFWLTKRIIASTTEYLGSGITKKGLCKAVILHIIVDQHLLASIDAAAMQFDKVVMGYVGYDTQLIQELLCSLPWLWGEHLDGNFLAVIQLSLHSLR